MPSVSDLRLATVVRPVFIRASPFPLCMAPAMRPVPRMPIGAGIVRDGGRPGTGGVAA
ncbi:hypothetical protein DES43_12636 [Aquamicrobium defluvii]|uniref:Uncharacterized protein n=1 Tax=Aquamicrobium defluvii TaxID=69279 RepID=A0A4R6YAQ0_9HYPH|nr:hypothetical protein DES43_12636 [Aquamicrobium defluvii]